MKHFVFTGMDKHVKTMLKLIEEDADSFAKKAEMYYKKRPKLLNHVEEFYIMYHSLAERYDHLTGELRKNIPTDLKKHYNLYTFYLQCHLVSPQLTPTLANASPEKRLVSIS
jgi:hypothetical protein